MAPPSLPKSFVARLRTSLLVSLLPLVFAVPVFAAASAPQEGASAPAPRRIRVLCLSGGGHHDFAGNSEILLEALAAALPIDITHVVLPKDSPEGQGAPDATATAALGPDLAERCDVILAYTQGERLGIGREQIDHVLGFVRRGGGIVGLHCAADTFKWCREWVDMIGGRFASHPPFAPLAVRRLLGQHPVLEGVEDFEQLDEFYYLDDCPLHDKHVLLVGAGPTDGKVRPLAWTKACGEGRVFYTALGHGPEAFQNRTFQRLVANAIRWAATRPPHAPDAEGWRTLFDGRSLEGWSMSGPGAFELQEDGTLLTRGGMGLLWFDRCTFRDFELEVDWKTSRKEDNSGVFVRFPRPPASPWDAVREGYEIQICDGGGEKNRTGAIYGFAAPSKEASRPPGEWNRLHVEVRGQRYRVHVNGEPVVEFVGERGREGYVGLQNHGAEDRVRFGRVRIRELR